MSNCKQAVKQTSSEPQRPIRADFTAQTLQHARVAKARRARWQQLQALTKEPLSMKSLKFLRTVPGAALALAVLATGSVGVYALNNWFNGDVTVRQNNSVLSVDLSSCKGNLPAGIDSSDRSNVQFRITGNPHISAEDLQRQLLAQCEFDAVRDFYGRNGQGDNYLLPVTIKVTNGASVTFEYAWGGEKHEKTILLAPNATIYKEGAPVSLDDLSAGDAAVIATSPIVDWQENIDPLDQATEARSIFVTQHDVNSAPSVSKKALYDEGNIAPLNHDNEIKN